MEAGLDSSADEAGKTPEIAGDAEGFAEPADAARARRLANLTHAGKGRPKGARNRASLELGAMVDKALHEAGGWRYLVQQAKDNPTAFLALVARRLPKELKAEITAEMTVRQEARRELIEQSVALMLAIEAGGLQRMTVSERREAPRVEREQSDGRTGREEIPTGDSATPDSGAEGGAKARPQLSPLAGVPALPAPTTHRGAGV